VRCRTVFAVAQTAAWYRPGLEEVLRGYRIKPRSIDARSGEDLVDILIRRLQAPS